MDHKIEPHSAAADVLTNVQPEQLTALLARFRRQHAAGAFPGGQLVVTCDGQIVCNEAIGLARGYRGDEGTAPQPVTAQTAFPAYSSGKPLAGVAIAMLEDRGRLDVNAPIAEVFPEFAAHGKAEITTLDVLTHRSGVLMPQVMSALEQWPDHDAMAKAVAQTAPAHARGTLAYAPWEFGIILSEVVRRVDGRTLAQFFADEVATPLGLPALAFGLGARSPHSIARSYWLGKDRVMVAGLNVAEQFEVTNNHAAYFASLNPACALITDATSLARFYEFILNDGVSAQGTRLLSAQLLRQYTRRSVFAFDRSLRTFLAVGRGFMRGTLTTSVFGWWNSGDCCGHGGSFSSLAGADYASGLSFAILTNGNRGLTDYTLRFVPLSHAIRRMKLPA